MVTKGGGDVIKFAGDCVIAVFQAEDYMDLEKDLDYNYSSLALATGQAIRVSVEMTNIQRDVVARASEQVHKQQQHYPNNEIFKRHNPQPFCVVIAALSR